MVELVENIALALMAENSLSDEEYGFISQSVKHQRRKEASRYLLDRVTEKNGRAERTLWETLVKMQGARPKLKYILKEIQKKGPNLLHNARCSQVEEKLSGDLKDIQKQHKEHLCSQNERVAKGAIRGRDKAKSFSGTNRYTELVVISSLRERRLVEHELLARGRDHEEWQQKHVVSELEKIRIHQLFRSSFGHSSLSGTSVVSGVAGIGKTTMVQKMVHEWALGNIYPQFQFVFHFKFRDLNAVKESTSLKDMVLESYPYLEKILGEIWMRPEYLLFVFDGLDEFQYRIDFTGRGASQVSGHGCTGPESRCEVSEIVRCLVQERLLKGCSVLLTSRPTALDSLEQANINLWAEILGFLAAERKDYFRRFFGDEKLSADVFKHVEENEILYTMCYNPSYCWITCSTLGPLFTQPEGKRPLPKTITQLFSNYVCNLLRNHCRDFEDQRAMLLRAGEMAYQGVSERVIVFNEDHFRQHQLEPSKFISGFMMEILERDEEARNVVYTFLHLTIQEFFAALAQYLTPKRQNVFELLNWAFRKDDGRFEIFLRFVVGLSSPASAEQLEEILGPLNHHTICQAVDWLKINVQAEIKRTDRNAGKRQLLNLFHYLCESQNSALAQRTVGAVERLNFGDSNPRLALRLSPLDCAVLSHVVRLCETLEELNLEKCYIQEEGVKRLVPAMHKCKVLRAEKVNGRFDRSDQTHEGFVGVKISRNCFQRQKGREPGDMDLRLNHNNIGDAGVKLLSLALRHPDCKTERLELQDNNLTAAGIEDLKTAFSMNHSVTMLYLDGNQFTDQCVPDLRNLILSCKNLELIHVKNSAEQRLFDPVLGEGDLVRVSDKLEFTEGGRLEAGLESIGIVEPGGEKGMMRVSAADELRQGRRRALLLRWK
ncbi:NACHT, LRR and PYD domains-containing protein 3-like [Heptranchias perlo]|uniref:NACHT, LRR and PYD domains-containing protein 3-like n=1 Tax=Heptranchias perlo TaxID=212740 RepID=UPI003559694E